MIATLRSVGVLVVCRHDTLVADDHAEVRQCTAAERALAVLSTTAKFRPETVRLSVVVKPRLGLRPSLTTGATNKRLGVGSRSRSSGR